MRLLRRWRGEPGALAEAVSQGPAMWPGCARSPGPSGALTGALRVKVEEPGPESSLESPFSQPRPRLAPAFSVLVDDGFPLLRACAR
jgi:hypothetical protein